MTLDAEDARLVVQLLGHVFPNALHLATTAAGGGSRLVADVDTRQVRRQRLAFRFVFDTQRDGCCTELCHLFADRLQVFVQRLFQQASLRGAEALGLRRKLQALEQSVLVREFVDGGLLEGDRLAQRLHHPTQFFCAQMQERVGGNVHEARVCQTNLCHAIGTSPD